MPISASEAEVCHLVLAMVCLHVVRQTSYGYRADSNRTYDDVHHHNSASQYLTLFPFGFLDSVHKCILFF